MRAGQQRGEEPALRRQGSGVWAVPQQHTDTQPCDPACCVLWCCAAAGCH